MKRDILTLKQKIFADEYIRTGNATGAAIMAGYNEAGAKKTGCENLAKPIIRKYIDEMVNCLSGRTIASPEEILEFLTRVVRGDEQDAGVTKQGDTVIDGKAAKISDRTKAAELLGKRHRLFADKVEHSGDLSLEIKVDYGD